MALKVKSDLKFEISGLNYQCSYDHWAPKRLSWGKWHEEKEEKKEEEEVLQSIYLLSSMQVKIEQGFIAWFSGAFFTRL